MRIAGLLLGIVLICAACNLSKTEVADLPTPTASVIEATIRPTRTPIALGTSVQVTQLAPSNTLPPPPLSIGIPTQLNIGTPIGVANINASATPDQAVKDYYTLVSQGRYDLGWSMLTDTFKQKFNCCAPNYNYTGYVQWWDSVNTVEFGNVKTVSQTGDRAIVYAELYYVMNDGRRSSAVNDPYIALVYDSTLNMWRFDDKRATA
jgi:hypothetical protein